MFWKSTGEVKFISSSHPLYVFTLTPKCVFIVSSACVETTAMCMLVYCSWTHIRHLMHGNEFYSCRIMLNQKRANSHREKANHVSFFFFSSAVHVEQNNSKSSFYFLSFCRKISKCKRRKPWNASSSGSDTARVEQHMKSRKKEFHLVTFHKQIHSSCLSIQISQRINLICLFFTLREYPKS